MTLLSENIHAETRFVFEGITAITGATSKIVVDEPPIPLHQRERNLFRLERCQRIDRWVDKDRLQFAIILHLQWMADGKVQIRDAVIRLQHRGQDSVEIGNSHRF